MTLVFRLLQPVGLTSLQLTLELDEGSGLRFKDCSDSTRSVTVFHHTLDNQRLDMGLVSLVPVVAPTTLFECKVFGGFNFITAQAFEWEITDATDENYETLPLDLEMELTIENRNDN